MAGDGSSVLRDQITMGSEMNAKPDVLKLRARLTTTTPLYIGTTSDREAVGSADLPILRDPLSDMPVIPGSTLRGRMAFLMRKGWSGAAEHGSGAADPVIGALFGKPGMRSALAFWDCLPEEPWVHEHRAADLPLTSWRGEMAPPRSGRERVRFRRRELVCAGVHFNFRVSLLVKEAQVLALSLPLALKAVREGLCLLEQQGIGGATSRGFGRIEFSAICTNETDS